MIELKNVVKVYNADDTSVKALDNISIKIDDGEYIEILKIDINEAINMVYNGKINDSKTIIALLAYRDLKYKGEI